MDWDSAVFIHRLEATPNQIEILRHVTDRAERGELKIATSAFTLCEVPDGQRRNLLAP